MSPSKEALEENDTITTMQTLQQEGKIRFLGMSGTIPNIDSHIGMGVFDVFQIPYSALQREHESAIAQAAAAGAGIEQHADEHQVQCRPATHLVRRLDTTWQHTG